MIDRHISKAVAAALKIIPADILAFTGFFSVVGILKKAFYHFVLKKYEI